MTELVGDLYWKTESGVMIRLVQVPLKELREANPTINGTPLIYAVWPEPVKERDDADPQV